jgi:hypothetical protein
LKLPGQVDRWLIATSRSPRIDFLQDYLMLGDVRTEYVDCVVKSVCVKVCLDFFRPVRWYFRFDNFPMIV